MNGTELYELMSDRWSTLSQLLEMSNLQMEAINDGRMSDLMRILSNKQQPLSRLADIAERIRSAAEDDPKVRQWETPDHRDRCRQLQEECEQLHLDLLAIEAQCESVLQESRTSIQSQLEQIDTAHRAANSYAKSQVSSQTGGSLDLSSD